jgi:hypothetical protein
VQRWPSGELRLRRCSAARRQTAHSLRLLSPVHHGVEVGCGNASPKASRITGISPCWVTFVGREPRGFARVCAASPIYARAKYISPTSRRVGTSGTEPPQPSHLALRRPSSMWAWSSAASTARAHGQSVRSRSSSVTLPWLPRFASAHRREPARGAAWDRR